MGVAYENLSAKSDFSDASEQIDLILNAILNVPLVHDGFSDQGCVHCSK